MRQWLIAATAFMLSVQAYAQGSYTAKVESYINEYKALAIAEQKRSGIPASIILAQGIHETMAGQSELATEANNHFGIKCKKEWKGATFAHTDDAPNECFRKYSSAFDSYIDHSDYLKNSPRYAKLFKNSVTDYAAWAVGLRQAGYATNPKYAQVLIKLIEDYRLQEYTYAALDNNLSNTYTAAITEEQKPVNAPVVENGNVTNSGNIRVTETTELYPQYGQTIKVNGVRAVFARKGDVPLEYALKYNIRYERLLDNNDIEDRPLQYDMYLYLERKLFTGVKPYHIVQEGETLHQIAQKESIQMKFLRAMNLLEEGEEPVPGAKLYLQHRTAMKPEVISTKKPETAVASAPNVETKPVAEVAMKDAPETAGNTVAQTPAVPRPVEEKPKQENIVEKINTDITPAFEEPTASQPQDLAANTIVNSNPVLQNSAPVQQEAKVPEMPVAPRPVEKPKQEIEPQNPAPQEPVDELDALKARFDKAIYSGNEEKTTPKEDPKPSSEPAPSSVAAGNDVKFHVVKKGETAFSITKRYNISMRQLMDWNNMNFETIKIGQKLKVKE